MSPNGDTPVNDGSTPKVSKALVVGTNTLIPIGAVVAVFLAAWQIQSYLDKKFELMQVQLNSIKQESTEFNHTVKSQLATIEAMMANRWTSQDMKIWEQELKIRNPTLNVPDSGAITHSRSASSTR